MRFLLLYLLLLTGCYLEASAPWLNNIEAPAGDAEAAAIIIQVIEQQSGSELDFEPHMHWVDQEHITVCHMGDCRDDLIGFTLNDPLRGECEIWVVLPLSERFSRSALAHELIHCAYKDEVGDPDSNHIGTWWHMLPLINDELKHWEDTARND